MEYADQNKRYLGRHDSGKKSILNYNQSIAFQQFEKTTRLFFKDTICFKCIVNVYSHTLQLPTVQPVACLYSGKTKD